MLSNFSKQLIQVYLGVFLIATLSLIAIGLYAQEATRTQDDLPEFLGNITERNCPDFEIVSGGHTMRDSCTGLVWSRTQLPTYDSDGDTNPGYSWSEAVQGCAALSPAGSFRLPTVEEALTLVTVQCDAQGCHNQSPLVVAGAADGSGDIVGPASDDSFFGGVFWTRNDYNEPIAWREGIPSRDYKRSINLLTGESDRPVYGQEVRLNAWCLFDIAPQVFDEKVVGNTRTTVFQRSCSTDADCAALTNPEIAIIQPYCSAQGRCAQDSTVTVSQISEPTCAPNEHLEGSVCKPFNAGSCTPPGNQIDNGQYTGLWDGNIFNGDYQCTFSGCDEGFHWNPTALRSQRCESDASGVGCVFDIPEGTLWEDLVADTNRLWTQDWDWAYPPFTLGSVSFGQGQEYAAGWSLCQATSCIDEGVTTELKTEGSYQICGCLGNSPTGAEDEYYWDTNTASCIPRLERFVVGDPQWLPYSQTTIRTCDGGTQPWKGPNQPTGCQIGSYRAESCIVNAEPNGSGCACATGFADVDGDAITGNSCAPAYTLSFYNNYSPSQNMSSLTPVVTVITPSVNFDWQQAQPHASVNPDQFGARITRTAGYAQGVYRASVIADDGVRLYVDGQLIIDEWHDQGPTEYVELVALSEGQHTIALEYYENQGGASLQFTLQAIPGATFIPDFVVGDNDGSSIDVYQVLIDGASVGATPGTLANDYLPVSSAVGAHQLRIVANPLAGSGEAYIALRNGVSLANVTCYRSSGQQRNCNYSNIGEDPTYGFPMYRVRFDDQDSRMEADLNVANSPLQL